MATATFGAGCFWGVELRFSKIPGVTATAVGYMGGHTEQPTYRDVCSDSTGHAEVVQVSFDPDRVDFETLLKTFFACHDPTQLNRQGPDVGSQYRSAVFAHDAEQEALAVAMINALNKQQPANRPIVTTVEPAATFWVAEDYHQKYLEKRGATHCGI